MRFTSTLLLLPLCLAAAHQPAPLLQARGDAEAIPDKYIVKLKNDVTAASLDESLLSTADHVFKGAFNGFAATLKHDDLKALLNNPNVGAPSIPLGIALTDLPRLSTSSRMPSSPSHQPPMPNSQTHRGASRASPRALPAQRRISTTRRVVLEPAFTSPTRASPPTTLTLAVAHPKSPTLSIQPPQMATATARTSQASSAARSTV